MLGHYKPQIRFHVFREIMEKSKYREMSSSNFGAFFWRIRYFPSSLYRQDFSTPFSFADITPLFPKSEMQRKKRESIAFPLSTT